jgi:hypothetical protein
LGNQSAIVVARLFAVLRRKRQSTASGFIALLTLDDDARAFGVFPGAGRCDDKHLMSRRYCGRDFAHPEIEAIGQLIAQSPESSRAQLSRLVCQHLHWVKPDGGLKEMTCRVAMLAMHDDGLITLPAPRCARVAGFRFEPTPDTDPTPDIIQPVHELAELTFHPVVKSRHSRLWNEYIQRYHYLGYTPLPGAQLRYFVAIDGQFVALLGFGAAAWKTAPRDQFIAWTTEQRQRNLHLVVNNARFLILPWVKSKHGEFVLTRCRGGKSG